MAKSQKKLFIFLIIIIVAIATVVFFVKKNKQPTYNYITVKRGTLTQEVSVTGKIKPAESVDLSFERSGKISAVYVKVGDKVTAGQLLVKLSNDDLAAQLAQYQAALEKEQINLEELKSGARPEEIQIAETKVANAEKTLTDSQTNLENIKNKANIDLANLYNDIPNILNDAYTKADDAVNKQTADMFSNASTDNPQITFTPSDTQAKMDSESQRVLAGNTLKDFKTEIDNLSSDYAKLDTELTKANDYLVIIRNFLIRFNDALNSATGITQTTINTYKGYLNTGRTNINTAISNIETQKQSIAAQKITNQNNISTAEATINTSENALNTAQDELTFKKAGPTAEEVAAQESQIKQAEANVKNSQAQLNKTILSAPISGIATKQEAKLGEIVAANTPLISLISENKFEIETYMPETDIAKVKTEQTARVTLDAYGNDVIFEAKVVAIDPAETVIEGVATYKTTLQFINEDKRVKSGMAANIDILTAKLENVIVLPPRTIITQEGEKMVKKLENKNIQEIKVKTGLRGSDGNIEILEGVNEGDKIIIP